MSDERAGCGVAVMLGIIAVVFIVFACVLGIQRDDARNELKALKRTRVSCPMCGGHGAIDLPAVEKESPR